MPSSAVPIPWPPSSLFLSGPPPPSGGPVGQISPAGPRDAHLWAWERSFALRPPQAGAAPATSIPAPCSASRAVCGSSAVPDGFWGLRRAPSLASAGGVQRRPRRGRGLEGRGPTMLCGARPESVPGLPVPLSHRSCIPGPGRGPEPRRSPWAPSARRVWAAEPRRPGSREPRGPPAQARRDCTSNRTKRAPPRGSGNKRNGSARGLNKLPSGRRSAARPGPGPRPRGPGAAERAGQGAAPAECGADERGSGPRGRLPGPRPRPRPAHKRSL